MEELQPWWQRTAEEFNSTAYAQGLDSLDVLGRLASRTHAISSFVDTRLEHSLVRAPQGMGCGVPTPKQLACLKWHVWQAYRERV